MQDGPEEAEAPPSPDGDGDGGDGEAAVLAPDPEEEAHRRWRALGARIATLQAVLRKKAAQAERSQLLASLQQLPCLASITEKAMERLCELGVRRTYGSGELLLADPPHADLGSASSSERVVGLICGGEAQLVGAMEGAAAEDRYRLQIGLPPAEVSGSAETDESDAQSIRASLGALSGEASPEL